MNVFSRAIQDTIYPIMGDLLKSSECISLDLSVNTIQNGRPIDDRSLAEIIPELLAQNNARAGIGGYGEKRNLYRASQHFEKASKVRDIHLGVDVWVPPDTPVYAPLDALIHSFAYNSAPLDYGYTLILQHEVDGVKFHTLYGHLGASTWESWQEGREILGGDLLGMVGREDENGGWYPHLHLQLIIDMEGMKGDYPGVCAESDLNHFKTNCPDPSFLLRFG